MDRPLQLRSQTERVQFSRAFTGQSDEQWVGNGVNQIDSVVAVRHLASQQTLLVCLAKLNNIRNCCRVSCVYIYTNIVSCHVLSLPLAFC
eukprot:scaffold16564_cov19-Prasinocladus_malaysianus.AAC.2